MWLLLVPCHTCLCECGLWLCVPKWPVGGVVEHRLAIVSFCLDLVSSGFYAYCGFVEIELLVSCMFSPGFANWGWLVELSFSLYIYIYLSLSFSAFFCLCALLLPLLLFGLCLCLFLCPFFLVSFFCLLLSSLYSSFSLIKLVLPPLSLRMWAAAFGQIDLHLGSKLALPHLSLQMWAVALCFVLSFFRLLSFLFGCFFSLSFFLALCFSLIPPVLFLSFLLLYFLFLFLSLSFSFFLVLSLSFSFFSSSFICLLSFSFFLFPSPSFSFFLFPSPSFSVFSLSVLQPLYFLRQNRKSLATAML